MEYLFQGTKVSHWFNIRYMWVIAHMPIWACGLICLPYYPLLCLPYYPLHVSKKLLTGRNSLKAGKGTCKHFTFDVAFNYSIMLTRLKLYCLHITQLIVFYFCCIFEYEQVTSCKLNCKKLLRLYSNISGLISRFVNKGRTKSFVTDILYYHSAAHSHVAVL